MVAESCLGSASVQESFEARAAAVAWTAAALMRRKTITFNPQASGSLQMQALLAPVATAAGNVKACTSWQDYYSELILSCFCMSAKSKSDQFAWRLACNVPVLFAAHSLFECSSTCSGSSAAREADNSAREAPFWRQKTWSKLSGPILQSALIKIRSLADSDNTNDDLTPLLATCALTASAASLKSIDSSTLADLTVVVVYSISRSRAHQGEHSEQMLALMRVSFDALEHLLKNNVEQFEPHLNIIVPALLQVYQVIDSINS